MKLIKTKRFWLDWSLPDFDYLEGLKEKLFEEIVPWGFYPPSFGSDEFDNHSIYWNLLGFRVVIFYEREMTPSNYWYLSGGSDNKAIWRNLEYEGWVEKPADLSEKRFMGVFEDKYGIDQPVWICPPAPISPELMTHLINAGKVTYCYDE